VKLPATKEEFATWKARLLKQLREKSFSAFNDPPLRIVAKDKSIDWGIGIAGRTKLTPQIGIDCFARILNEGVNDRSHAVVILNPDDDLDAEIKSWDARLPAQGRRVFLYPRGGHQARWTRKNPPNTVERSVALLGQTVDSGRVRDVIDIVCDSVEFRIDKVWLAGRGQAGVVAAYAALLAENKVAELQILDPPTSHRDGPHFLNVDRVLDLPTALGLLAPDVKLTLINAKDKAFDKTAALYKLAGAEAKFERK
jgi:hypothetical protein